MADILHDLPIQTSMERLFLAVSTPKGLDTWWTLRCTGEPREGAEYGLWFGPEYAWRARVSRCSLGVRAASEFELEMVDADSDWLGTRVGMRLEAGAGVTWLRFRHTGWPNPNKHFRVSSNCWAMYLRILRRSLEHGESVPYADRLTV